MITKHRQDALQSTISPRQHTTSSMQTSCNSKQANALYNEHKNSIDTICMYIDRLSMMKARIGVGEGEARDGDMKMALPTNLC